jgi:putative transposase
MIANQAEYSIQMVSRTLGVARSGFQSYCNRPPSARQVADQAPIERIMAIHIEPPHLNWSTIVSRIMTH